MWNKLRDFFLPQPTLDQLLMPVIPEPTTVLLEHRSHPAQSQDYADYVYIPHPNMVAPMYSYVMNHWVYTAVAKIAEAAAAAHLEVIERGNPLVTDDEHPLLQLLGKFGKPNDAQDAYEFWEMFYTYLDITGNAFIYWYSRGGGQPSEAHLLDPRYVEIEPGSSRTIARYRYDEGGLNKPLSPISVTHVKKPNPYNRYYGLSALAALDLELQSDRSMIAWNRNFFAEEVSIPTGVVVVPAGTSDEDMNRIETTLFTKHGGGKRRTAVIRAGDDETAASAAWLDIGTKHKDTDFKEGRLLSRQAVYEALGLPLGLMSEASTEAHALVSERQLAQTIAARQRRVISKLNVDALPFYPNFRQRECRFADVGFENRDWKREALRLATMGNYFTVDEVRADYYKKPPMKKGETPANGDKSKVQASPKGKAGGSGDNASGGASTQREANTGSRRREE